MNSFDLKVLLKQKKLPKKIGDLIRHACLDGDKLQGVNFHELTYQNCSFFNLTIIESKLSDTIFLKCLFNTTKFCNSEQLSGRYTNCVFMNCYFVDIKFCLLHNENTQFINCTFEGIEKLVLDSYSSSFINCQFVKVNITNSQIKSCLILQNDFVESRITNSPFQSNYLFENKFFKVKNVKATNYLASFYKNVYLKSTGFEKDLIHHEEQKSYIMFGQQIDNMKNYTRQIVALLEKK